MESAAHSKEKKRKKRRKKVGWKGWLPLVPEKPRVCGLLFWHRQYSYTIGVNVSHLFQAKGMREVPHPPKKREEAVVVVKWWWWTRTQ